MILSDALLSSHVVFMDYVRTLHVTAYQIGADFVVNITKISVIKYSLSKKSNDKRFLGRYFEQKPCLRT